MQRFDLCSDAFGFNNHFWTLASTMNYMHVYSTFRRNGRK
jgi:hypothetical protein